MTKFETELNKIRKQSAEYEKQAVRKSYELLDTSRKRINDILITAPAFDAPYLPMLRSAIEQEMAELAKKMEAEFNQFELSSWDLGAAKIDTPLEAMGISISLPSLSPETLKIAQAFSADLIKGLTDEARAIISQEISIGILTGRSITDVAKELGKSLTSPGRWKTITDRAEEIVRTELARIETLATRERLAQAGELLPDLKAEFRAEPDACDECLALAGIYDIDKVPDLPHPNCECDILPYREEWKTKT